MSYGARYLKVSDFIEYAKKLKVDTNEKELEYYELKGMMFPTARIVFPEEFVRRSFEQEFLGADFGSIPEDWKALERLKDPRMILLQDFETLSDEDLIHAIDREFDKNPYLLKPDSENFKPWKSYRIPITYAGGEESHRSTVEHYYTYWQVFQLYEIQKYPELYRFRSVIESSSNETVKMQFSITLRIAERFKNFNGLFNRFDALSLFMTIYHRERRRTFAPVSVNHGIQRLTGQQFEEYLTRNRMHGADVMRLYSLTEDELFTFVVELLGLHDHYKEKEKFNLASQIENDITFLATWLMTVTNRDFDGIADEVGRRTHGFNRRKLRHLDDRTRMHDMAIDELIFYMQHLKDDLKKIGITNSSINFGKPDITGLIDYCDNNGFDMLSYTLDEMVVESPADSVVNKEKERKFQRTARYTRIKNASTALEYLLRQLAQEKHSSLKNQMTPLVSQLMGRESWIKMFRSRRQWVNTSSNDPNEFLTNLSALLADSTLNSTEDGFWTKNFLLACLARNLTVHTYPTDDWFYGDFMGEMVQSILYCYLYSWHVARRDSWVENLALSER